MYTSLRWREMAAAHQALLQEAFVRIQRTSEFGSRRVGRFWSSQLDVERHGCTANHLAWQKREYSGRIFSNRMYWGIAYICASLSFKQHYATEQVILSPIPHYVCHPLGILFQIMIIFMHKVCRSSLKRCKTFLWALSFPSQTWLSIEVDSPGDIVTSNR